MIDRPAGPSQLSSEFALPDLTVRKAASRPRLAVVEDDDVTRAMIGAYMADQSFDVSLAETGEAALRLLKRWPADIVFIDIQLPDCDGLDLARTIRASSAVGIIFVTQNSSETDRIMALELAGDDYVSKPLNLRELLARTRALLRRRQMDRRAARDDAVVTFGNWLIDHTRRELTTLDGDPIRLTRGEFDLIAALVRADGRPLSRDYLVEVVSNRDTDVGERTVDALIARLRRKLKSAPGPEAPIVTVNGFGYRLGLAIDRDR